MNIYNILKHYYYKNNYISNNYKSHIVYVEHNLYNSYANITFNNTNNISKAINQYTTDVVNNYRSTTFQI